jgi:hypothetical protein
LIKQIAKFTAKLLLFTPQQRLAITAGEFAVKGVKKAYKNNQEAKQQRELQEQIANILNRGFFKTLLLYFIGFIFSLFIMQWGWIGIILVFLGYLGHYLNLKELQIHVKVLREKILTWVFIVSLVLAFFII